MTSQKRPTSDGPTFRIAAFLFNSVTGRNFTSDKVIILIFVRKREIQKTIHIYIGDTKDDDNDDNSDDKW